MTTTEMIRDMLGRQKIHDVEVFKKHNITSISREQLERALFDELGELMHAQKADWCWWKFTQEPVDVAKVFEEYVDVLHFALMFEITYGDCRYQNEDIEYNYRTLKFDSELGQAYVYSRVLGSVEDDDVLAYVIALGLHMGFSLEEIYKEYIRKNEINKERLASKETPKKPIDIEFGPCGDLMLCCPNCNNGVVPIPTYHGNKYYPRCPFCGQKLEGEKEYDC